MESRIVLNQGFQAVESAVTRFEANASDMIRCSELEARERRSLMATEKDGSSSSLETNAQINVVTLLTVIT